jgi:hypothetical protein
MAVRTTMTSARRRVDSSAVSAFLPVIALVPVWLLALTIIWLPLHVVWHVSLWIFVLEYLAAGLLLFFRPVQQLVLAPLLGPAGRAARSAPRSTPHGAPSCRPTACPAGGSCSPCCRWTS